VFCARLSGMMLLGAAPIEQTEPHPRHAENAIVITSQRTADDLVLSALGYLLGATLSLSKQKRKVEHRRTR